MANEERENQAPQRRVPGMGELPRALGTERGELTAFDLSGQYVPPGGGFSASKAADLHRGTNLIEQTESRKISPVPPPLLYNVTSTYDSRPIQGYDFQASGCGVIEFNSDAEDPITFDPVFFDFIVPANSIAVLRKFRYFLSQPYWGLGATKAAFPNNSGCWLRSDILDDDVPIREYTDMRLGAFLSEPIDAFSIFDERHRIRLRLSEGEELTVSVTAASPLFTTGVKFFLYGNILVKSGIPKEFEIANPMGGRVF